MVIDYQKIIDKLHEASQIRDLTQTERVWVLKLCE